MTEERDPEVTRLAEAYADEVDPEELAEAVERRLAWRLRRNGS